MWKKIIKTKIVQEQWLQLKWSFYWVMTWKLLFGGLENKPLAGNKNLVVVGGRGEGGGIYFTGDENEQIFSWWGKNLPCGENTAPIKYVISAYLKVDNNSFTDSIAQIFIVLQRMFPLTRFVWFGWEFIFESALAFFLQTLTVCPLLLQWKHFLSINQHAFKEWFPAQQKQGLSYCHLIYKQVHFSHFILYCCFEYLMNV